MREYRERETESEGERCAYYVSHPQKRPKSSKPGNYVENILETLFYLSAYHTLQQSNLGCSIDVFDYPRIQYWGEIRDKWWREIHGEIHSLR